MRVDVYPVGWLAALRILWRTTISRAPDAARGWAWSNVTREARLTYRYARAGNWHNVKALFNGYLAEPNPFPDGMRRCGSGWTRRRAVRSLYRHGWRQPCNGPYHCPTSGETECCPTHSGWDRCCDRPDLHSATH